MNEEISVDYVSESDVAGFFNNGNLRKYVSVAKAKFSKDNLREYVFLGKKKFFDSCFPTKRVAFLNGVEDAKKRLENYASIETKGEHGIYDLRKIPIKNMAQYRLDFKPFKNPERVDFFGYRRILGTLADLDRRVERHAL
ncbi:hypothetical protein HN680_00995 [Candidatus Peregrinibacteria bacterium]|mgnify:CR=1 FL=1|jgi:hypothetical protein|nr:hypothetical protein [Candidatus Peregrinibacteria bacterium]